MRTSEVCGVVSRELGLVPALSERRVTSWLRGWPVDQLPPVVCGRRVWGPEHVRRLREQIERAQRGVAASPAAER